MKRIEFIEPVSAMRGKLSARQEGLKYPTNDNTAFEAPSGVRSYARNYNPSFIGAKVAKSGLKYFAVKTKTAVTMSDKSRLAMALLGCSWIIAELMNQDLSLLSRIQTLFLQYSHPKGESVKHFIQKMVRDCLKAKTHIVLSSPMWAQNPITPIKVVNPFISDAAPEGAVTVAFPTDKLIKFWSQLANNPITFVVDGQTGLGHDGEKFGNLVGKAYNLFELKVLSIQIGSLTNESMVTKDSTTESGTRLGYNTGLGQIGVIDPNSEIAQYSVEKGDPDFPLVWENYGA